MVLERSTSWNSTKGKVVRLLVNQVIQKSHHQILIPVLMPPSLLCVTNSDDDFGMDWGDDLLRIDMEHSLMDVSSSCGLVSNRALGWGDEMGMAPIITPPPQNLKPLPPSLFTTGEG